MKTQLFIQSTMTVGEFDVCDHQGKVVHKGLSLGEATKSVETHARGLEYKHNPEDIYGQGTPEVLMGAINNANRERAIAMRTGQIPLPPNQLTYNHVKDFMAQAFTIAYSEAATPGEMARLEKLYKKLTRV